MGWMMKKLVILCSACGVGKSTIRDELTKRGLLNNYECIEYNNWFQKNANKFQFFIDNTNMTIEETVGEVANFIKGIIDR